MLSFASILVIVCERESDFHIVINITVFYEFVSALNGDEQLMADISGMQRMGKCTQRTIKTAQINASATFNNKR